MPSKADLILHPVRMRIIQTLLGQERTTQEIAEALPDIPPASLYRHLSRLAESGIVTVVKERRVRGAVERTYAVALQQAVVPADEIRQLDRDDHLRLFMAFIASVIDGYRRYLDQDKIDLFADMVSYGQAKLYLNDDELRQLGAEYGAMMQRATALGPGPGRRARTFTTILVPEPLPGDASRATSKKKGERS